MIGIFILQQFPDAQDAAAGGDRAAVASAFAQFILGILGVVMRILAAEQPVGMVIATVAHVAVGASDAGIEHCALDPDPPQCSSARQRHRTRRRR